MKYLNKIFTVATKLKTPLSITGLAIIILYLVIKQILSLNIFENIGGEKTYLIISDVLNKIFWVAIIALFLGVVSYIIVIVLKKRLHSKNSNLKLIDSRNDEKMSQYTQTDDADGTKTIKLNKSNDIDN